MKKIATRIAIAGVSAIVIVFAIVSSTNAQLFPYTGNTTSTTMLNATITTSSTLNTSSSSSPLPTPVVATPTTTPSTTVVPLGAAGFMQFNGLVVSNVSGTVIPATINATNPAFLSSSASTTMNASTGMIIAPPMGPAAVQPATVCESFATQLSTTGTSVACPMTGSITIQASADTQLLLSDRTTATLGNITPGDTINVFGYYDGAGNIQASVIRDLSKPVAGVTSTPTPPTSATIASIQSQIAEIQTLLGQLIQEVNVLVASSTTTMSSSSSISEPMIPYVPGVVTTPATSTDIGSGTQIFN